MAKTPQNPSLYLKVIASGEIVRCICYNDMTAIIEAAKGDLIEISFDQVTSVTNSEVNCFLAKEDQSLPGKYQNSYPDSRT